MSQSQPSFVPDFHAGHEPIFDPSTSNNLLTEQEHRLIQDIDELIERTSEVLMPDDMVAAGIVRQNLYVAKATIMARSASRAFPELYPIHTAYAGS